MVNPSAATSQAGAPAKGSTATVGGTAGGTVNFPLANGALVIAPGVFGGVRYDANSVQSSAQKTTSNTTSGYGGAGIDLSWHF